MDSNIIVSVISGVAESGVISFVVFKFIKGLKNQIDSLKQTIEIQNKTIEAMDKRTAETEKLSELYKKFIEDYPQAFDAYKTTIVKTKDETIFNLQDTVNEQKNEIDNLKKTIESVNPEDQKKFEKAISLVTKEEKYKHLYEISKNIGDLSDTLHVLANSDSFTDFLTKSGYTIQKRDDTMTLLFDPNNHISHSSQSITGLCYAISFDKQFYIPEQVLNVLEINFKEFIKFVN